MPHGNRAFSLVELSLVLVILGLLIGSVLSGQSLIRAAEMRSVGVELQRFQTATRSFRDKYFALPGDMNNATSFWGTDDDCTFNNQTPAVGTETCNGNGNGAVGRYINADGSSDAVPSEIEQFRFWQHLANAGLIEGKYAGVSMSNGGNRMFYTPGTNSPKSRFNSNSAWAVGGPNLLANASTFPISGGFVVEPPVDHSRGSFIFGSPDTSGNSILGTYNVSPAEAWQIDTKLDDGLPLSGKVLARDAHRCIAGGAGAPAASVVNNYMVSANSIQTYVGCTMYFTNSY